MFCHAVDTNDYGLVHFVANHSTGADLAMSSAFFHLRLPPCSRMIYACLFLGDDRKNTGDSLLYFFDAA